MVALCIYTCISCLCTIHRFLHTTRMMIDILECDFSEIHGRYRWNLKVAMSTGEKRSGLSLPFLLELFLRERSWIWVCGHVLLVHSIYQRDMNWLVQSTSSPHHFSSHIPSLSLCTTTVSWKQRMIVGVWHSSHHLPLHTGERTTPLTTGLEFLGKEHSNLQKDMVVFHWSTFAIQQLQRNVKGKPTHFQIILVKKWKVKICKDGFLFA